MSCNKCGKLTIAHESEASGPNLALALKLFNNTAKTVSSESPFEKRDRPQPAIRAPSNAQQRSYKFYGDNILSDTERETRISQNISFLGPAFR
ncbi:hypothetical protein EVAR_27227_1 [Eumeta japonica]|uniref:Uncharacterized protein n=1 Tax=Eumeta variegata TaxID=151549 RepID=A0A4C1VY68_EUMVA|nr:hypothetical protein EVAR_27227_1 [Eumeta japonica]